MCITNKAFGLVGWGDLPPAAPIVRRMLSLAPRQAHGGYNHNWQISSISSLSSTKSLTGARQGFEQVRQGLAFAQVDVLPGNVTFFCGLEIT